MIKVLKMVSCSFNHLVNVHFFFFFFATVKSQPLERTEMGYKQDSLFDRLYPWSLKVDCY